MPQLSTRFRVMQRNYLYEFKRKELHATDSAVHRCWQAIRTGYIHSCRAVALAAICRRRYVLLTCTSWYIYHNTKSISVMQYAFTGVVKNAESVGGCYIPGKGSIEGMWHVSECCSIVKPDWRSSQNGQVSRQSSRWRLHLRSYRFFWHSQKTFMASLCFFRFICKY
jgi:hypothetical protein